MSDPVAMMLRAMAWQRAKGELYSILETYPSQGEDEEFESFSAALENFINLVEDEGMGIC